ncbi:unnamed protein product [Gongylonema pulchrum]|uniref:Site-specific DNA-methyltransferase (cytosine-N(4)-specific) n=1 Tax=Gongylonema pulchrum TaxID=637853 RepID=A0A183DGM1_9BILA|nr:unnamed protein product [Gongylonema pulchrum]
MTRKYSGTEFANRRLKVPHPGKSCYGCVFEQLLSRRITSSVSVTSPPYQDVAPELDCNYLTSHKYRNADHDDLWNALNTAVPDSLLSWDDEKLDIRDFASKWTQQARNFFLFSQIAREKRTRMKAHKSLSSKLLYAKTTLQMGYPVVEVRRIDEKRVELHQKRFKWDETALEREQFRNARFWCVIDA